MAREHLLLIIFTILWQSVFLETNPNHRCFCKLQGEVDDCSCKVENVDSFNNLKVFPRLNSLLQKNFFRFFKVNLHKKCPFWADDGRCALRDCAVDKCKEEELPEGLKVNQSREKHEKNKYSKEANTDSHKDCENKDNEELGTLDTTISAQDREAFKTWKKYDDAQDLFCEMDDEDSADLDYVDLLLNPERYTGYKGVSPQRVWNSIYKENCFQPDRSDFRSYVQSQAYTGSHLEGMCLEKRVFYRMVSGLHTSINVHLCSKYLFPSANVLTPAKWGPNINEFKLRFDPETTNGQGPQYLKNLYFTYLVEMRALAKVGPYLQSELFYTGDSKEEQEVQTAVKELMDVIGSFPEHFDESKLFQGDQRQATELKNAFKTHFRNISRIMDCVGCDKCKLWGKLQTQGMGTALKILFSGSNVGPETTLDSKSKSNFQLSRTEIVSLFNAFGRLSTSIKELDYFRQRLK